MIVAGTIVSILFSLLLFEIMNKTALKLYQSIMFFPFFFSWVLVGLMMGTFLNSGSGMLTRIIHQLTGMDINFYTSPAYWPLILVVVAIWKSTGYSSLIYYAVLMGIDKDYYEAAEIDGASRVQKMYYITLPFLAPMVIVLTILAIGGIMNADFGLFYFVPRQQGALLSTTDVIDTYVFRALRQNGDFTMSAAVALFQSTVGFILILITNAVVGKYSEQHKLF
jgi:putative aldouronate transport system permease protein